MSKNKKKISPKPPEAIKIGGYKITQRQKAKASGEYELYITYRDIDAKFWDDIYREFDKLYSGNNFKMFLHRWDRWYIDLTKTSKQNQYLSRSTKDHGVVDAPQYEISSYPSPWQDGISKECSEKLSKFSLEERWQFIQTLTPPTRNIASTNRTFKKDFIERKCRKECRHANAYSILLLKKTYFTWLRQNVEQATSINQVYTSISVDKIADKISKVDYKEFVFCGAIPSFVLSNGYLSDLQSKISTSTKNTPVLYTLILLYPSLENINALSKLRKAKNADILREMLRTYNSLLEKMQVFLNSGIYVRVLYVDQPLPYDIYLLDSEISLISFSLSIPAAGWLRNPVEINTSSNTEMLLYLDKHDNELLIDKFTFKVYEIWSIGIRKHSLDRFICTTSFGIKLCNSVRQVYKTLSDYEKMWNYFGKDVDEMIERMATQVADRHSYLPPDNHPFRKRYRFLFESKAKDERYSWLVNDYENKADRDDDNQRIDGKINKKLNSLYKA